MNIDDKDLVIVSVFFLGIAVIFAPSLTELKAQILLSLLSGLFGIAVGRATKKPTTEEGEK